MIIADVHAHIFPHALAEKASASIGGFYATAAHHIADVETLLSLEQEAGIGRCAVSSSATTPAQVTHINDFIAQTAAQNPNLVGLGTMFPTMDGWETALEHLLSLPLRGIKIHPDFQRVPIDAPAAVEMYRAIARAGLPVLFHMGDSRYDYSAPERLGNLLRQVPDLVAIAAHFGGWQSWDRSYAYVLPENVYYDTSSSLMFLGRDRALKFLDHLGPDRFLFGTDFPMWTPAWELRRFLSLGLDADTQDRILHRNFERLFGLSSPAHAAISQGK